MTTKEIKEQALREFGRWIGGEKGYFNSLIDDYLDETMESIKTTEKVMTEIKSTVKELTGEDVEDVLGSGYEEYSAMDETSEDKWRSQGYVEGGKDERN